MTIAEVSSEQASILQPLLADLRSRRRELHALGHIPQDIIARFQSLGIYRAFVPEQLGGAGMSPVDFLKLIETISAADGSAGWVASFGFASKYLSSLPAETLAEIYQDSPDIVFAGAVFPPQLAVADPQGYRVSGKWGFGSGCMGASLIGVGIKLEGDSGGLPRMAVMPRERVTIRENWDTIGMFATGSHDLVVEDVVVPAHYTLVRGAPPSIDTAIYRYPTMAMATQVLSIVAAGVAREALDEIVKIATTKNSITGAPSLADRPGFQIALAQMEAQLSSARAWFYEVTESLWQAVKSERDIPVEDIAHVRIACTHIAKTGADVARRAFELSGTTGIFNSHPLSRHLLDAMVVAQHAFMNDSTWQSGGSMLVGKTPPPGYVQDLGNGHSVMVMIPDLVDLEDNLDQPIPDRFTELAVELRKQHDEKEVGRIVRAVTGTGFNVNLFPNLACSMAFFRALRPINVSETEIRHIAIGMDGGPEAANRARLRLHEHFQGPMGFGTPDDAEAWERVQRGSQAGADHVWIMLNRGEDRTESNVGDVTAETGMRAAYQMWKRMMTA